MKNKNRRSAQMAAFLGIVSGFIFLAALWTTSGAWSDNAVPILLFLSAITAAIVLLVSNPARNRSCDARTNETGGK